MTKKWQSSRDVSVKVAGATIGIRGTDVWGKADDKTKIATMEKAMGKSLNRLGQDTMDFDVVCLIEGKIDVTHNNEVPFVMDQAQTFCVMPKNETPLPVSALSTEQLDKLAADTEITANQGATCNGGKWKVNLLTTSSEHDALAAYDELRSAGYDARIQTLSTGNINCASRNYQAAPKRRCWHTS